MLALACLLLGKIKKKRFKHSRFEVPKTGFFGLESDAFPSAARLANYFKVIFAAAMQLR